MVLSVMQTCFNWASAQVLDKGRARIDGCALLKNSVLQGESLW